MKQIPLPIAPPPDLGFDRLVVGRNAQAVAHMQGLARNPGASAPVYLWGVAGSGKTRLLHALAASQQADGARVGW